jgi:hypothetical protein
MMQIINNRRKNPFYNIIMIQQYESVLNNKY